LAIGEEIEDNMVSQKLNIFFIVDRSGSMNYPKSKMDITK